MEPTISNIDEARQLLELVREVGEPLERGDLPCDFTIEEIKQAHGRAALIMSYMTRELRTVRDAIDHRDADVFGQASSYLRTLSYVLLRSEDVTEQQKMVLQFCTIATSFVSMQIIRLPDDEIVLKA